MKKLIIIAALSLFSWVSQAESQPNQVKIDSCGQNTILPKPNWGRTGYILQVCKIGIGGLEQAGPIYGIEYVSNTDEHKMYAYEEAYRKPLAGRNHQRRVTLGLRIIGSVEDGLFNRIMFIRAPDADDLTAYLDKRGNVVMLTGEIQSLESEVPYKLRVTRFEKIHENW